MSAQILKKWYDQHSISDYTVINIIIEAALSEDSFWEKLTNYLPIKATTNIKTFKQYQGR